MNNTMPMPESGGFAVAPRKGEFGRLDSHRLVAYLGASWSRPCLFGSVLPSANPPAAG